MHNHPDNRGVAEQSPHNQPQNSSKIVPPGIYQAILVEAEFRKSSHGTPGWHAKVEIIGGPHAGRRFWADYWLSKPAKPVSKDRLARMELYCIDDLRNPPIGREYAIDVAHRAGSMGRVFVDIVDAVPMSPADTTTNPQIRREPDTERQRADERRACLPYEEEEEVYYTEPQPPDDDDDDDDNSPFDDDYWDDYSNRDF
ncbi:MAG: hypothetical protein H3C30_11670 [Candidatus Hydrogenedentes bacterium]|nr:hypothetical protein [Candidatus Hydrogenedentota bacterium]